MNTIYELYSSDGLTRETIGTRGRNVAGGGGAANFFALTKINFSGRSEMNFGARTQRVAQRGGIVFAAPQNARKEQTWKHTK